MKNEMALEEMLQAGDGAVDTYALSGCPVEVGDEFAAEVKIAVVRPGGFGQHACGDAVLDVAVEEGEIGVADGDVGDIVGCSAADAGEYVWFAWVDRDGVDFAAVAFAGAFPPDLVVGPVDHPFHDLGIVERVFEQSNGEDGEGVAVVFPGGVRADAIAQQSGDNVEQHGERVGVGAGDANELADHLVASGGVGVVGEDGLADPPDGIGSCPAERPVGRLNFRKPTWVRADDDDGGGFEGLVAVHVVLRSLLIDLYERCEIDVPDFVPHLIPDYVPMRSRGRKIPVPQAARSQ
jgi:hypothetical protein